jgi:hypothetical protein
VVKKGQNTEGVSFGVCLLLLTKINEKNKYKSKKWNRFVLLKMVNTKNGKI